MAFPLYDRRFEHDACGVGFVADAGGRSAERVLPLALAGLAALGHRGAFAADGASSDGAGVTLPLEPAVLERLAARLAGSRRPLALRPGDVGVVVAFLPRSVTAARRARRLLADEFAAEDLPIADWREVPTRPGALGPDARASLPSIAQAFVARPAGLPRRAFEQRLIVARRRAETAVREAGLEAAGLAIPSASSRTVVYKGLVAGGRLAELYPDLEPPLAVRSALFHQRYATNTRPEWRLAQPFRLLAHNGEINTVRGNRQQVTGRAGDRSAGSIARRLREAGPLLAPGVSDSASLDEAVELLVATGWPLDAALLALVPEAAALRRGPHPTVETFAATWAGFMAPWDGPAAIVFGDGRRVGALVDRNGLRPLTYAVTRDRVVCAGSEAGAIPITAAETARRARLGPGEMLIVDMGAGAVLEDAEAKHEALRRVGRADPAPAAGRARASDDRRAVGGQPGATSLALRFLAGVDAERLRLDIRTMTLERHEPLWSMGDDTPLPGLSNVNRPAADHLRQAFAQVTNPAIDPERERAVFDLSVTLGRRPALLGGPRPSGPAGRRVTLASPVATDLGAALDELDRGVAWLAATWPAAAGPAGLEAALERLAARAVREARRGTPVVVLTDRGFTSEHLPIPSVLAAGAVHAALSRAGLRGRTDLAVDACDVLDVHSLAMALAAGATVVRPWLGLEIARELAGGRAAETLTADEAAANLVAAFEAGLRKVLARMGISTAATYVGGMLFETVELGPEVVERCFPDAPGWPGRVGFVDLADHQLQRRASAAGVARAEAADPRRARLPDPGLARFRADGERHLYAPPIVDAIQGLAGDDGDADGERAAAAERAGAAYRAGLARPPTVARDGLRVRRPRGAARAELRDVEPAGAITRRFVAAAMSVGALSPEAHRAITVGMQRAGGAANTGEGGEDPDWYAPGPAGERRDARIKQVASARFGVTAAYLARADQLEIKIAQGSKPGEGGQLPGRKATAYIAMLRRAQPGQSLISPPPHHDIYSIEDLAQLIADLRAANPPARIGVKLVATRGIGTIAAGVAKAGADYIHVAGHSGGTGASPLSSIKHVGAPWELGLAEVHQTLVRQGLRDRVALRTDGGLQTGRDLLVAALLGAEEFAFGTPLLVALGCDMARQCHLDTCPTGIATQRDDLRAKFRGTPEQVERFVVALAEDLRRELATIGARTVGEIVGRAGTYLAAGAAPGTLDVRPLLRSGEWPAGAERRASADRAATVVPRAPASALEIRLVAAFGVLGRGAIGDLEISTADRSFGARLSGALERGEVEGPLALAVRGAAGQSFGAFATRGLRVTLEGQANDYVAKGLSGGTVIVRPEPDLAADATRQAIAGNTCLYGATAGRLHVVGRAGMRFGVRNSGAEAVVEGLGAHGCEYMTGGVVVVLGPVGPNFGAGMTGGRAYLLDPEGRHPRLLHPDSVVATRLIDVAHGREDGAVLVAELRRLLEDHAAAGSDLAASLMDRPSLPLDGVWLVEPARSPAVAASDRPAAPTAGAAAPAPARRGAAVG